MPIASMGLAAEFMGEGESGAASLKNNGIFAPDSPSPHACTHLRLVWSMMAFDPTTGKT